MLIRLLRPWKVDVRLPGKGNIHCHGARLVHQIIPMMKLIKKELPFWAAGVAGREQGAGGVLLEWYADKDLSSLETGCSAIWKRAYKLPWREAVPPNHLIDKVDS